ncbi:MAG: SDR family NAD(P)-dependent oxidoreductase [Spirochaetales bacterium]|nr:SDR family NAD(P)-dependent oxidoreductase [Spirochaetales bacterium]
MKNVRDAFDKVVIITGSSRGIGFHTAELFLEHGAKVALNGRNPERLASAQKKLDPTGEKTLTFAGDMSNEDDAAGLMKAAIDTWGRIDILICNAGVMMRGRFSDLSGEVVHSVINANIVGVALPIIKALPEITRQKGTIEIISSLAGVRGMPHISLYCGSKMALTAITEALWIEQAGSGVHVGILYVGITENDPEKRLLGADGSPIKVTNKSHSTMKEVAAMVFKQIRRRRRKIVMTPAGKALEFAQWLMPRLLTFLIAKAQKTSEGFAQWEKTLD